MSEFKTFNILDLIKSEGEKEVENILSDFLCEKNNEIEKFVRYNAIDFSNKKMSITYLVFDENMELMAIFALTHKVIQIVNEYLSKSAIKKIKRFSQLDEENNTYTISAFLIAQFGKNSNYKGNAKLTGNHLMALVEEVLKEAQKIIGGGTAYLECEDKEKLLNFYQSESNGYRIFNERYSQKDNVKYIQLFKLI